MLPSTILHHHLVAELKASHEPFERYEAAAFRLADMVLSGDATATDLRRFVGAYVRHLHVHHTAEELRLFPALRQYDPVLGPAIDQLLEHHRQLAKQLDVVDDRLHELTGATVEQIIPQLVEDLTTLGHILTNHLAHEESTVFPIISRWDDWPFDHPTEEELS